MEMRPLNILLLEDDAIEVMKFERAITSLKLTHTITNVTDGEKALEYLNHKPLHPDLILLDLHMPKIDGIEFLKTIQKNEILKYIPKVVLTTSSDKKERTTCYALGVAGYILKPLKYKDYVYKVAQILSYWSINEIKC